MGIKIIEPTWSQWETFAARPNVSKYYIQHAGTYEAIAIDLHFVYHCTLNVGSEIADFETNHKSGSTAVTNLGDAIGLAFKIETIKVSKTTADNAVNNAIFVQPSDGTNAFGVTGNPFFVNTKDGSGNALTSIAGGASSRLLDVIIRDFICLSSDHVLQTNSLTTTTTTADQIITTYTVPTGKEFLLTGMHIGRIVETAVDAAPYRLRVNGVTKLAQATAATGNRAWALNMSFPIKLGTADDVITITVTPAGVGSTTWNGAFWGYLRSI